MLLRLPVEILHRGQSWQAETEDLGPGGCLVLSPHPLVERAQVRLVLRCDGVEDVLNVAASVAWARDARGGVAFASRQPGLAVHPDDWFERVLDARPGLASGLRRAPDELALEDPVYLLPPPRRILDLAPDQVALLRRIENGIRLHALLASTQLSEERAAKALLALFEKNVLTLSMGQASEVWKWRAALAGPGHPGEQLRPAPPTPAARGLAPPAPAAKASRAPVVSPSPGRAPPGETGEPLPREAWTTRLVAGAGKADGTLLRGAGAARRSPEAQGRLEQARAAAGAGRIDQAVALLRQALALAPRDAEISTLLGQLAFRDRKR